MTAEPIRVTDELSVTAQPSAADIRRFAELGYRTIINNRPDGEEPGQLSAAEAKAQAEAVHLAYVHLPIKVGQIAPADVDAFHRALKKSPRPVLAHCKTGTRSYFLWAAGEALAGRRDPSGLIAQAAATGYDLRPLPDLVARLRKLALNRAAP
jgi:sulfide:quinone oxidoreductase